MVHIALCIPTYQRPESLARLLNAVAGLAFDGKLSVIVVDNDIAKKGYLSCGQLDAYRWPLTCLTEERRGISFARNHAVRVALEKSPDFIAMLDDDEWPSRNWLRELLRVQTKTGAAVVGGPVLPIFPPNSAPWSNLARHYGADQRRSDCATCILYAGGNFFARSDCFRSVMPTPFEPDFFSSGEDLVFFNRLSAKGYKMAWSTLAKVYEPVVETRMNLCWLKQRQLQRGNVNVRSQRIFAPGIGAEAIRFGKTIGLFTISCLMLLLVFPHPLLRLRAVLLLYKAKGKLIGHFGCDWV